MPDDLQILIQGTGLESALLLTPIRRWKNNRILPYNPCRKPFSSFDGPSLNDFYRNHFTIGSSGRRRRLMTNSCML